MNFRIKINASLLLVFSFLITSCQEAPSSQPVSTIEKTKTKEDTSKAVVETKEPQQTQAIKNYKLPDWPIQAKTKKGKGFPYDEALKDPGLVTFRQKLYNAVKEKDVEYLLSQIDDFIKYSFDGDDTKAGLIKTYDLNSKPETSAIWQELETCLELGGGFIGQSFYAPFVFVLDDIDDPYMEGVIIGDNVRLRKSAGLKGEIIGSLSWDHFQVMDYDNLIEEKIDGATYPWMHIKTKNGAQGYVYGKYARIPIDYRVGFSKDDSGAWKIVNFIAGD